MTTELIKFLKGIFQGNSLSVLFIISLNTSSFMLKKTKGYFIGEKRKLITHTISLLMI